MTPYPSAGGEPPPTRDGLPGCVRSGAQLTAAAAYGCFLKCSVTLFCDPVAPVAPWCDSQPREVTATALDSASVCLQLSPRSMGRGAAGSLRSHRDGDCPPGCQSLERQDDGLQGELLAVQGPGSG